MVQIGVEVLEDGTARLTNVTVVPCSVSSRTDRNDYPTSRTTRTARRPFGSGASWKERISLLPPRRRHSSLADSGGGTRVVPRFNGGADLF